MARVEAAVRAEVRRIQRAARKHTPAKPEGRCARCRCEMIEHPCEGTAEALFGCDGLKNGKPCQCPVKRPAMPSLEELCGFEAEAA